MTDTVFEIIGLNGMIVESVNKQLVGITGKIIDETKHMLIFNTKFGKKLISKNICKFEIYKNNKIFCVNNSQLMKRPHEHLEVYHE